jgi:hypothetical protein
MNLIEIIAVAAFVLLIVCLLGMLVHDLFKPRKGG